MAAARSWYESRSTIPLFLRRRLLALTTSPTAKIAFKTSLVSITRYSDRPGTTRALLLPHHRNSQLSPLPFPGGSPTLLVARSRLRIYSNTDSIQLARSPRTFRAPVALLRCCSTPAQPHGSGGLAMSSNSTTTTIEGTSAPGGIRSVTLSASPALSAPFLLPRDPRSLAPSTPSCCWYRHLAPEPAFGRQSLLPTSNGRRAP